MKSRRKMLQHVEQYAYVGSQGNGYTGKAGQLAVMGELAWRGYNVALPEIDKGDDIFSVDDRQGQMIRLQVKAAKGKYQPKRDRWKYEFRARKSAIERAPLGPELHFVFACRVQYGFRFVVVSRDVLNNDVETRGAGKQGDEGSWRFDLFLHPETNEVLCGASPENIDWTVHLEDWRKWPQLIKR